MTLPSAFLDDIRSRTTLSALVGRRVKLTRAGREFKGLCPVHSEKSPSFTVNDDKGFAHCFGCGFHADAIGWLVQVEGRDFIEAVRELAEGAGVTMPERSAEAAAHDARRENLRPPLEAAQQLYAHALAGDAAVRATLAERGITPELIATFAIGFAPAARGHLARGGIEPDAAVAAGLMWEMDAHESRSGNIERGERFVSRIMIPVHDRRGRLCGFAGRHWAPPDAPAPKPGKLPAKYVNSPQSDVFDKGRLLFNLHRAAAPARAARRLILVEGQLDCVAMAGAGIAEAVAPMGTALTEAQLAMAWSIVPDPVLLFDGDAAGRKAARRAAETALPQLGKLGQTLRFALLPDGEDPDTLARAGGREAVEAAIATALPCDEFLWRCEAGSMVVAA